MSDDREAALALCAVSCETLTRLEAFLALLQSWQTRTNLIANSTLPHLWTRHVADSLQLIRLAPQADTWIDIGSGGGFPGIVLACVLAERPNAMVHLVERNGKKAAFLREALRVSGAAGTVHQGDVRDCKACLPSDIDIVSARAVAPLNDLLALSAPWLLKETTIGLFHKGQDVEAELKHATASWNFAAKQHRSLTGPGAILEITRFRGRRSHKARSS